MSDELFPLPESRISDLDAARVRLELAHAAYATALDAEEFVAFIPRQISLELRAAQREVLRLESHEIERRRATQ